MGRPDGNLNKDSQSANRFHNFTALPNWLLGRCSPFELAALWCLQVHRNAGTNASTTAMAEEIGISRRALFNVLQSLEDKGWITRHASRRHSNQSHGRPVNEYELNIWGLQPFSTEEKADA